MAFRDTLQTQLDARGWIPARLVSELYDHGVTVSHMTVERWLAGDGLPRVETVQALSRVLGVSIDALLAETMDGHRQ